MGCINMTSGLVVYNDTNNLQITDSFKNLQFLYKGTTAPDTKVYFNINDIIAFNCADGNWVGMWINYKDTSFPYPRTDTGLPRSDGGTQKCCLFRGSSTITYYVFGFDVVSSGHYFEVKNSVGEVVFSDSEKFMKVIASCAGQDGGNTASPATCHNRIFNTTAIPLNTTPAVIPGLRCWNTGWGSAGGDKTGHDHHMYEFQNGAVNSLYKNMRTEYFGEAYARASRNIFYNYLLIDVTNL